MQRAIAEIALIGLAGGALGCWVVLYELSYAAESLAHSLFPGLVIAALAGVPLLLGAAPAIVARGAGDRARRAGAGDRAATSPSRSSSRRCSASACCWRSRRTRRPGVEALLFGDILGPTDADLIAAAVLAVLVAGALWLLHSRLLATGFDRGSARGPRALARARSKRRCCVLLGAAVVVAVQGLGNLLVVAVLVGPAAAARQLTDRIVPMIALAAAIAVLAGIAGLYALLLRWARAGGRLDRAGDRRRLPARPALGRLRGAASGRRAAPGGYDQLMATTVESSWAEHALETLQGAGLRRGGARTAVVEALAGHDCAVTALELDDELRRRQPAGRPGQRLPGARPARGARPGAADRGHPRHRRLRAGRAQRPPSPSRDLPRLRAHGDLRGPLPGAGDRAGLRRRCRSRSPSTTSSCAGSARAARTEPAPAPRGPYSSSKLVRSCAEDRADHQLVEVDRRRRRRSRGSGSRTAPRAPASMNPGRARRTRLPARARAVRG